MAICPYIRRATSALIYLCRRYNEEGCTYRAAALAYTSLLSLVPLASVVFFLLSFIPAFQGTSEQIQDLILKHFIPNSQDIILRYFNEFMRNATHLSLMDILSLVFAALLLMYNINRAFVTIWHAERNFQLSLNFLWYAIILFLSPFLFAAVIFLGAFLQSYFVVNFINFPIIKLFLLIFPYVVIFITFTLFNWVLPSAKVKLLYAAIGGFVTMVLFELAKIVFRYFLSISSTYQLLYGALSVVPIFLLWLYVFWTIILLGAVVSNTLAWGISPKDIT